MADDPVVRVLVEDLVAVEVVLVVLLPAVRLEHGRHVVLAHHRVQLRVRNWLVALNKVVHETHALRDDVLGAARTWVHDRTKVLLLLDRGVYCEATRLVVLIEFH